MAEPLGKPALVIKRHYDSSTEVIRPETLGLSAHTTIEGLLMAFASGFFGSSQPLWPGDSITVFESEGDLREHLHAIKEG